VDTQEFPSWKVDEMNCKQGMIHSIAMQLSPTRPGTIRATMGHQAHAAFLRAVKEADPTMADILHHPIRKQRPFTVSPLMGTEAARDGRLRVDPAETYTLRFTILLDEIFRQFMGRFLRGDRPELRLGRSLFLIKEILATPEGSPWAGYTSFAQMARQSSATKPLIDLEFLSPTAFSFGQRAWGKQFHMLPDPRLVFSSLARTWQAFAPPGLHLDQRAVERYADENVIIQRLDRLETRMLHFGRHPQLGFMGRVTYRIMDRTAGIQEWCRILHALADFAFYAGVGYKTTMGMGQCRRVSDDQ
jgi:CRISPR-associated endoribonuclease Cas6